MQLDAKQTKAFSVCRASREIFTIEVSISELKKINLYVANIWFKNLSYNLLLINYTKRFL